MHCASGHPWRREGRNPRKWNVAFDYAINGTLQEAHINLPPGALLDPAYTGKPSEWIYDRLPDSGEGEGPEGDGEGSGDGPPTPLGEVRDGPAETAPRANPQDDWKAAVTQAAKAAEEHGSLPGSLKRLAKDASKSRVDWKSVLRRFIQDVAAADYSWTRPNRRYLNQGLYLPALHSEAMGPIAVAVDTSASIDDVLLGRFGAELRSIVDEAKPARVSVIYCDARVQRVDHFAAGEPIGELDSPGGGGTAFEPVFEALQDMEEEPVCLVYLTDLEGSFPSPAPEIPTLWAAVLSPWAARAGRSLPDAPFGEVVEIEDRS